MITQELVINFINNNKLAQLIGQDIIVELTINFKKGKKDLENWLIIKISEDPSDEKLKALQRLLRS